MSFCCRNYLAIIMEKYLSPKTAVPGKRALVCPALDCWPEPCNEQGRADSQPGQPARASQKAWWWARREVQSEEMGVRTKRETEQGAAYFRVSNHLSSVWPGK